MDHHRLVLDSFCFFVLCGEIMFKIKNKLVLINKITKQLSPTVPLTAMNNVLSILLSSMRTKHMRQTIQSVS